jgi:hypothetical protein
MSLFPNQISSLLLARFFSVSLTQFSLLYTLSDSKLLFLYSIHSYQVPRKFIEQKGPNFQQSYYFVFYQIMTDLLFYEIFILQHFLTPPSPSPAFKRPKLSPESLLPI